MVMAILIYLGIGGLIATMVMSGWDMMMAGMEKRMGRQAFYDEVQVILDKHGEKNMKICLTVMLTLISPVLLPVVIVQGLRK